MAFAASDAHAAKRGQPWQELSAEYLFYYAKRRDGKGPSTGTSARTAAIVVEHDGQPREIEWPYLVTLPSDLSQWQPPPPRVLYRRVAKHQTVGFQDVWKAVEGEILPVVVMTLSPAFFVPGADGVVDSSEPIEPSIRHAVVGVATGERGHERLVMVRNSWGQSWGVSGHAWITESYAQPRISTAVTFF